MFYKKVSNGFLIEIKVVTRSSKSSVSEIVGDRLKVNLTSPPVEGKANKELVRLLSKKLKIPKTNISIIKRKSSANKTIFIESADEAAARLLGFEA